MNFSKSHIVLLVCASLMWAASFSCAGESDFDRALREGAEAKILVSVTDDCGRPVADAIVKTVFEMGFSATAKDRVVNTDTNGTAVVVGNTSMSVRLNVEKQGYYNSSDAFCLISKGHEYAVTNGKWQPWGIRRNVVLLPRKNPVATRYDAAVFKFTSAANRWVGFDVERYDFVKPYGGGEVSDFDVFLAWDGKYRNRDYTGMSLRLRFSGEYSGAYYAPVIAGSSYVGVYAASPDKSYTTEFEYSECPIRDKRNRITHYERKSFDPSKVLVGRSRCVLHEDGTLKSANYFQLYDVKFACDKDRGAGLSFQTVFNPRPNDTNLEPK